MQHDWHAASTDEVLAGCRTRQAGLTDEEAGARRLEFGPNQLPPPPRVSALEVLGEQLRSVIVYLLAAAFVVSLIFGDTPEAAAIAAVLVVNTLIGFVTEFRARRAMEALVSLEVPTAAVVRDGALRTIPACDLVPGDVVEVDAGRRVPADGRLISASDLRVNEAALTGESLPVGKATDVLPADTPLGDRANTVFMGTTVAAGLGRAIVTATGEATEIGRIGRLVSGIRLEPTPLERRLDALGGWLVWLTLGVAAVVGGLGLINRHPLHSVIETAIALAVAAVPEALPAVATIALAVGMSRMAKRRALVRRLPAVESLGSTTVVCTDKTRTLTSGEMTVVRASTAGQDWSDFGGAEGTVAPVRRLLEAAALASRSQPAADAAMADRADPVDRAMLVAAARAGLDVAALRSAAPAVHLVPFSSDRKWMAAVCRRSDELVAFVKGAPATVLSRCGRAVATSGDVELTEQVRSGLEADLNRLAGDGLRVLAVAEGPVADPSVAAIHGLTLLGFIGLADPPAAGVAATIERLRQARLRTVMLTGDHHLTAQAVGRELGVIQPDDIAIDGRELDRMSDEDLTEAVGRHAVFSRITPEHKLAIVRALQQRGEVVAMLGDGVNDAAALRQADVGVAMGRRGTDAAKQASAIVLEDDRFETVAVAVEEGRVIYDNIRKFVFYLFSCNVAEVLVLLTTGLAGLPLPLLPLQLLWLNIVTDTFPALALAMEPADPGVMSRPPRPPDEALLSAAFVRQVFGHAGLITAVTLAAFLWALPTAPDRAQTVAFMTLALAQIAHLGNARRSSPVLAPRLAWANPYALAGVGLAVALQAVAYGLPAIARTLGVTALDARQWTVVMVLALAPAVVVQAARWWRSR